MPGVQSGAGLSFVQADRPFGIFRARAELEKKGASPPPGVNAPEGGRETQTRLFDKYPFRYISYGAAAPGLRKIRFFTPFFPNFFHIKPVVFLAVLSRAFRRAALIAAPRVKFLTVSFVAPRSVFCRGDLSQLSCFSNDFVVVFRHVGSLTLRLKVAFLI